MASVLDTATTIFERRFLKNAFLPVLLFPPAVAAPPLIQGGRVPELVRSWDQQSSTLKLLELAGYLTIVWFVAAILESQWGNLTRFFEGYRFRRLGPISRAAIGWHERRRKRLGRRNSWRGYYAYTWDRDATLLPTRLGNILRAAEYYPKERYNADVILLWPRLYRVLPVDFAANLERARERLEFLLVLALWFAALGVFALVWLVAADAPAWLTTACFAGGMASAYLCYVAALPAAQQYGDRLRTAFELYRLDLLARLRFMQPRTIADERDAWSYVHGFMLNNDAPLNEEKWWYRDPPAPEATLHLDVRLARRGPSASE